MKRSGFTFIELIIAATIFSIIAVSIYSTIRAGTRVWQRANSIIEVNQEMRIFFDTISLDLKNAILYYGTASEGKINFDGEPKRMSFMTLVNLSDQGSSFHQELAKVIYYFDSSKKTINRILAAKDAGFSEGYGTSVELVNDVNETSFKYCYQPESAEGDYIWKDEWEDKSKIPRGVRIKVDSFEKTIFTPTGELGVER